MTKERMEELKRNEEGSKKIMEVFRSNELINDKAIQLKIVYCNVFVEENEADKINLELVIPCENKHEMLHAICHAYVKSDFVDINLYNSNSVLFEVNMRDEIAI